MQRNFIKALITLPFELLQELIDPFLYRRKLTMVDIRRWKCQTAREKMLIEMIMHLQRELKEQANRHRKERSVRQRALNDQLTHLYRQMREQKARDRTEVRELKKRHREEIRELERQHLLQGRRVGSQP